MAKYSKGDLLGLYREALKRQREGGELDKLLQTKPWYVPLKKTKALTELECDTIRAKVTRRRAQGLEVMRVITEKDSLDCYIGFSRVVVDMNAYIGGQIFPFIAELGDLHPPLKRRPLGTEGPRINTPMHSTDSVVVLWLVTSETDMKSIHSALSKRDIVVRGPHKSFGRCEYQEVALCVDASTLNPIRLFLITLREQLTQQHCKDLLGTFPHRPHLAVLTRGCTTTSEAASRPGDVVIVTRSDPEFRPQFTELEHMTELWKLKGEAPWRNVTNQWTDHRHQMQALARLYAELKSPEEERTEWFRQLNYDSSKSPTMNEKFRRITQDHSQIVQVTDCWTPVSDDVLSYAPSDCLLEEARASMLYAPSSYPLVAECPPCVDIKFGRATSYSEGEGAIVSSPDAVSFYHATDEILGMKSVAVMQVACEGVATNTERTLSAAAECAYQFIKHLANSVQLYSS